MSCRSSLAFLLLLSIAANLSAQSEANFLFEVSADQSTTWGGFPERTDESVGYAFGCRFDGSGTVPSWWTNSTSANPQSHVILFTWLASTFPGQGQVNLSQPAPTTVKSILEGINPQSPGSWTSSFAAPTSTQNQVMFVDPGWVTATLASIAQNTQNLGLWGQKTFPDPARPNNLSDWRAWVPNWGGSPVSLFVWMPTFKSVRGASPLIDPHVLSVSAMAERAMLKQELVAGSAVPFIDANLNAMFQQPYVTELFVQAIVIEDPSSAGAGNALDIRVTDVQRTRILNIFGMSRLGLPCSVIVPASSGGTLVVNCPLSVVPDYVELRGLLPEEIVTVQLTPHGPAPTTYYSCDVPHHSTGEVLRVGQFIPNDFDLLPPSPVALFEGL